MKSKILNNDCYGAYETIIHQYNNKKLIMVSVVTISNVDTFFKICKDGDPISCHLKFEDARKAYNEINN